MIMISLLIYFLVGSAWEDLRDLNHFSPRNFPLYGFIQWKNLAYKYGYSTWKVT